MSRIPWATYRVQLHAGFTFRDAAAIVPFLSKLGVSHLYTSPVFTANPGSSHGYDVVDYSRLSPELGGTEGFAELQSALRAHNLKLLVDFVPNHMGIAAGRNAWWQDVLEHGPWSEYASFFDIEWAPPKSELAGKVLLPVLGDHYGVVLERGELKLRATADALEIAYFDNCYPVDPVTFGFVLDPLIEQLGAHAEPGDPDFLELQSIAASFQRLASGENVTTDLREERLRESAVNKRRLSTLLSANTSVATALQREIECLNGEPGQPSSFDRLDALLEAQHYRLAYWRVAAEEINYRRFFAINELAGIRQEEPAVFERSHAALLDLIRDDAVHGVRIDHPDGLLDPAGYVANLRSAAAEVSPHDEPLYVVLEKILEPGESIPADWDADGTVGYEFARFCTGLFVDSRNEKRLDDLYIAIAGEQPPFADLVYDCKRLVLRVALASELNVLARALDRITEQRRRTRDFTLNDLRVALREVIACFPVYRTYTVCDRGGVAGVDAEAIESAVREARRRNSELDPSLFDFTRSVVLLERDFDVDDALLAEMCHFTMKFQQLTGPVMAKGLEDTAFFRFNRLLALNEVGGDPATFGIEPSHFHAQAAARVASGDHGLLASSTHDTKRSADVRARIAVISEIPREWRSAVMRWRKANRRFKTRVEGRPAPSSNDEYAVYQTLVGSWPSGEDPQFVDRIVAWAIKSAREANVFTSWVRPHQQYEEAFESFIRSVLDPNINSAHFDLASVAARIGRIGAYNSLSMRLLELTSPGVPDIYQGTELMDLSLVDPDNRRPVDFGVRARLLEEITEGDVNPSDMLDHLDDGRAKLITTHRALRARFEHPELYASGAYLPGAPSGGRARHLVAFARVLGDEAAITIAPRLIGGLSAGATVGPLDPAVWDGTTVRFTGVPDGRYREVMTERVFEIVATRGRISLSIGDVLKDFPVALLVRDR